MEAMRDITHAVGPTDSFDSQGIDKAGISLRGAAGRPDCCDHTASENEGLMFAPHQ